MGRRTTDLWLSRFISDGFQSAQRRRTTATFFDFSRAYDCIWCTGRLMKMSMMGVPRRSTEWLSSWFINCTARVRVIGSIGPSRTFNEGLPQGSVLFSIYVDDLLAEFEKDAFVSAYADDLLIACSSRNKDMIVVYLQPELDKVVIWSDKARLTLSTSKCKTAFFSLDCRCGLASQHHHRW